MTHQYILTLTDKNARSLEKRCQGGKNAVVIGPQCRGVPIESLTDITPPDSSATLYTESDVDQMRRGMEKAHAEGIAALERVHQQEIASVRHEVELEFEQKKRALRKDNAERSRTALVAKISEHVAPLLGDFPYNLKEVRHVGEVFDFLVYDGLEAGHIKNVVFLEVKTKRSGARVTNPREQMLRDAVNAGRVTYEVYVPEVNGAKRDWNDVE